MPPVLAGGAEEDLADQDGPDTAPLQTLSTDPPAAVPYSTESGTETPEAAPFDTPSVGGHSEHSAAPYPGPDEPAVIPPSGMHPPFGAPPHGQRPPSTPVRYGEHPSPTGPTHGEKPGPTPPHSEQPDPTGPLRGEKPGPTPPHGERPDPAGPPHGEKPGSTGWPHGEKPEATPPHGERPGPTPPHDKKSGATPPHGGLPVPVVPPLPGPPGPHNAGRPRRGRKTLLLVGATFLAGTVATAGVLGYQALDGRAATPASPAKSAPANAPTAGAEAGDQQVPVNSEKTDRRTLQLTEAFPLAETSMGNVRFKRVKQDIDDDCTQATAGPFAQTLRDQGCRRVLRATFVDADRRYAVTAGIAVLPTREAALRADRDKNLAQNLWFRPLPGPRSTGAGKMHLAGGYAAGLVWGRYIIFAYATHTDGQVPRSSDDELAAISSAFRDYAANPIEKRVNG